MASVSGLDSRVSNNSSRERMMVPERASAVQFEYRIEPKVYSQDEWEWPANTPYPPQEETILAWLRSNDLHNEANAIDDIISLTSIDEDEPSMDAESLYFLTSFLIQEKQVPASHINYDANGWFGMEWDVPFRQDSGMDDDHLWGRSGGTLWLVFRPDGSVISVGLSKSYSEEGERHELNEIVTPDKVTETAQFFLRRLCSNE